jgi:hypothetical protein
MTSNHSDWDSWPVESPPSGFAEGVVRAALEEGRLDERSKARPKSRRPRTGLWWAFAAASAGAAALAGTGVMMGRDAILPAPKGEETSERVRALDAGGRDAAASAASVAKAKPLRELSTTVIDRKLREEVRAKIQRAPRNDGEEQNAQTRSALPAASLPSEGRLTSEYIRQRIREDFIPLARSCYESALVAQPELRGKIVIDFAIVGDAQVGGIVDRADLDPGTDIRDPEFLTCMQESMLSMVFEPPDHSGWVTVTYPFEFSPDSPPEPARSPGGGGSSATN